MLFKLFRVPQALHNLVSVNLTSCDRPVSFTPSHVAQASPLKYRRLSHLHVVHTLFPPAENSNTFLRTTLTSSRPQPATTSPARKILFQGPGSSYQSRLQHISHPGLLTARDSISIFLIPGSSGTGGNDFSSQHTAGTHSVNESDHPKLFTATQPLINPGMKGCLARKVSYSKNMDSPLTPGVCQSAFPKEFLAVAPNITKRWYPRSQGGKQSLES